MKLTHEEIQEIKIGAYLRGTACGMLITTIVFGCAHFHQYIMALH